MNRKSFFRTLGIGAVAAIVAPKVLAGEPERGLKQYYHGARITKRDIEGWKGERLLKMNSAYINGYHKDLQLMVYGFTYQDYPVECDLVKKTIGPHIPDIQDMWASDWIIINE